MSFTITVKRVFPKELAKILFAISEALNVSNWSDFVEVTKEEA
jgi:hypothetical protein